MNEPIIEKRNFIGYEYKDVVVNRKMEAIYADGYINFGWTLEDITSSVQKYSSIIMKFKRDRKIRNKMELTRLQRQFEACVSEIETLDKSKVIVPSAVAYGIGLLGTAAMAGSVFSHNGGNMLLCIILAIPGFIGWITPYFFYTSLHRKKTIEIDPLIENKYDEIYDVCEKANSLLAN